MAKLVILFATLTALILLTEASIRTTVIVDEPLEDNQRGRGRGSQEDCYQQFQQAQNLRSCQQFIQRQTRGRGYNEFEDEENQRYPEQQQGLQECCRELRQMDDRCRCQGLRQAVQQQQQQQTRQGQELRQAFQVAQNLPSRCNLPPQQCDFQRQPY